ncbi:MAG: mechanosensitive ion channel family protein [Planctomycetota bacterium]|jgi:MscS family membrane protein
MIDRYKFLMGVCVVGLCLSVFVYGAAEPTLKDVMDDNASIEDEVEAVEKNKPIVYDDADSKPDSKPKPKPSEPAPVDDLNRGVPRSAVLGFFVAAEDGDFERAAEYFDLRYLPYGMNEKDAPELARQFKIVLDRALWIDPAILSTESGGHSDDGLYASRDSIGSIDVEGGSVELLLQRLPREDGVLVWKIAGSTVRRIPDLYDEYGYGKVGERLSKLLPSGQFLGLYLWQWIMAFGILLIVYCIVYIPTKIISIFIRRHKTELREKIACFINGPLRFLITLLIGLANVELIHPSMKARAIMKGYTSTIFVSIWAVVVLIGIFQDLFVIKLKHKGSETAIVLLRPVTRIVQFIIIVLGMMLWFENLGFKATTLLTGLGVGGLAVALAAQKSIENIIGAITLFASAPIKIGDFGQFGDVLGTVEEIGLRYTDIRTRKRTIVHIPNAVLADMKIENFTDREKMWYHPILKLSRKTSPDQIRYVLVEVRKMLYAHPVVDSDLGWVRFKEYSTYSLDIEVYSYIKRTDYALYLEVSEDLNLRIMDIIAAAGTELAVPVQNVWFEQNAEPDPAKAEAAVKQVTDWKDTNQLPLPQFPQKTIDELNDTLDYPPKGSAVQDSE